jgi:hypothetical protein
LELGLPRHTTSNPSPLPWIYRKNISSTSFRLETRFPDSPSQSRAVRFFGTPAGGGILRDALTAKAKHQHLN